MKRVQDDEYDYSVGIGCGALLVLLLTAALFWVAVGLEVGRWLA